MKITCESCGSKYTIADAKVKGRKVKVRCKGCKESILVDGTQLEPSDTQESLTSSEDAPDFDDAAPKTDTWSVNLSDDDSREMTLDELVGAWRSGVVTSDAYVWKDGMGDWKPILEVGELKLKLGSPPGALGVVSSTKGVGRAGAAPVDPAKMSDLFGGADLTGTSAPPRRPGTFPGGDVSKPTGARNDSSVLFSLDSLKSGADAPKRESGGAEDIFGNLGMSTGVLQSNTALLTAPAKEPPPAPVGARFPAHAAPAQQKSKTGAIVGAILGAAVIIGGALFFLGGSEDASQPVEAEAAAAAAQAAEEAKKKAEEAKKKADEERRKLEQMQKELEEKQAKEKAEAEKLAAAETKESNQEDPGEAQEATTASGSPAKGSPAPASAPKPASGPGPFNVSAAKSSLATAAANAAACAKPGGPSGSGKVQVTFSTSGRVTSATVVSGPFGGTAVGGCVASTFRRARVPAFSGNPTTVAKSFRVP